MKKILVTGVTGFIGKALVERLNDYSLVLLTRAIYASCAHTCFIKDIDKGTNYSDVLCGVDVIIHTAAKVHVMKGQEEFQDVNTLGTLNLARQAASAGVKRFIFLSTAKVNGECTELGKPFAYTDAPKPSDPYSFSKAAAESGLRDIERETGIEVVIIRPPLVYGPGVKANFAAMMKLAQKNLPLPLGAIYNKRSLVALDNLVDLIVTCIEHSKAANQTFLVSDDQDVSTTELLQMMTRAAGKTPWLMPVPVSWLRLAAKLTGKQAVIDRLCGNLQLDINHTKATLDWRPVITITEQLQKI